MYKENKIIKLPMQYRILYILYYFIISYYCYHLLFYDIFFIIYIYYRIFMETLFYPRTGIGDWYTKNSKSFLYAATLHTTNSIHIM